MCLRKFYSRMLNSHIMQRRSDSVSNPLKAYFFIKPQHGTVFPNHVRPFERTVPVGPDLQSLRRPAHIPEYHTLRKQKPAFREVQPRGIPEERGNPPLRRDGHRGVFRDLQEEIANGNRMAEDIGHAPRHRAFPRVPTLGLPVPNRWEAPRIRVSRPDFSCLPGVRRNGKAGVRVPGPMGCRAMKKRMT